nr:type II secretion system F family protein [uncultured Ralstonia sp.]
MTQALSWRLRRRFYEQAESQISNGVPLLSVLHDFKERVARRSLKASQVVEEVHRQVRDGSSLTLAMGDILTDLERDVLAAGEKGAREKESSGGLPNAMRLILEVREMTDGMRLKLLSSFATPAVLVIVLWATLAVIGGFVVPRLVEVLPLEKWTGWAYVMYWMGELAVGWMAPLTFGSLIAFAGWSIYALPRWIGAKRSYFDRRVFPFTIYREVTGFTWLMSYLALIRAGVPEIVALKGQIGTAAPWLASRLSPVAEGMEFGGLNLVAALRRTGYEFPSLDLIDEVGAYVGFDNFTEKMEVALRSYAKALERRLLFKGAVISGVFTVVMFVAFFIVALGSNSVSSILASSMGQ